MSVDGARPTELQQDGRPVWVEYENRTHERYELTIRRGEGIAYVEVEPCWAGGVGLTVEGPFEIGLAPPDREVTELGRKVADDRDVAAVRDGYLLVTIDATGVELETSSSQRNIGGMCRESDG